MIRACPECGGPLPEKATTQRVYCGPRCKNAAVHRAETEKKRADAQQRRADRAHRAEVTALLCRPWTTKRRTA